MTYKELLSALHSFNQEQLDSTVTVYDPDSDEYFAAELLFASEENDRLDTDHPIISPEC